AQFSTLEDLTPLEVEILRRTAKLGMISIDATPTCDVDDSSASEEEEEESCSGSEDDETQAFSSVLRFAVGASHNQTNVWHRSVTSGPGDHDIIELAFTLSKAAAEHYGRDLGHCTGRLMDAVLYPARHCVWLNWPSRGSLHDFYEASLAICSRFLPRLANVLEPLKQTGVLGTEFMTLSALGLPSAQHFIAILRALIAFCGVLVRECMELNKL
ncbi:hypothetical protein HPB47_001391, partial [Ixodes persulcatus]